MHGWFCPTHLIQTKISSFWKKTRWTGNQNYKHIFIVSWSAPFVSGYQCLMGKCYEKTWYYKATWMQAPIFVLTILKNRQKQFYACIFQFNAWVGHNNEVDLVDDDESISAKHTNIHNDKRHQRVFSLCRSLSFRLNEPEVFGFQVSEARSKLQCFGFIVSTKKHIDARSAKDIYLQTEFVSVNKKLK